MKTDRALEIAARVIAKADREHAADAVLRAELMNERGLPRALSRQVAQFVFDYYRWFGWLDLSRPLIDRVRHAFQLAQNFAKDSAGFSDSELLEKALPGWVGEFMDVATDWVRALQTEPVLWLRARPGTGEKLAAKLGDCYRPFHGIASDAVAYRGSLDLFRTSLFQSGEFELQDLNSQAVGWICSPHPGEIWWDACAGEGGKTLHLADSMKGTGVVWATDRADWRLARLKRRAARAQLFNYRLAHWEGNAKRPARRQFDGVLLDAPCSGTGTWQRNPHARWTTTAGDIRELGALQQRLLAHAAPAVRLGGKLVYSVCTQTRLETIEVAKNFAAAFPDFEPFEQRNPFQPKAALKSEHWFRIQDDGGNGMYVTVWRRKT